MSLIFVANCVVKNDRSGRMENAEREKTDGLKHALSEANVSVPLRNSSNSGNE